MRNFIPDINEEQQAYLNERGFVLCKGIPEENEQFPYITLHENYGGDMGASAIYHLTSTSTTLGVGAAHPTSSQSFSVLVQMIESMVGNGMKREGKEIFTNTGDPIKIFMLDPKWKTVVDLLLEKYQ